MYTSTRFRWTTLLFGVLLTSACNAAGTDGSATKPPYTDGNEYVTLQPPYQRVSDAGKVEVVEVFSYACVHCAEFSPYADALRKSLPPDVVFKLVPAPFNDTWVPFARAYYAAKKLGVVEQTHDALFKAKFQDQYPIDSPDEIANFYAAHGVDKAKFVAIEESPEVYGQIKKDLALIQTWGVDGTPTIVVDGKYRTAGVGSFENLVAVTKWLVQKELHDKSK